MNDSAASGTSPREHVELRLASAPRVTITLGASVWETLRGHARESRDGLETAGFLFGEHVRFWDRRVSVGWATRMVKERAEHSALFDTEALVVEKARLRQYGVADRIDELGSWHTHPMPGDAGRPSDQDLATWRAIHDYLGRPYVGLILTAAHGDARWIRPRVCAWIFQRESSRRRPICERALVEVDGKSR
jgi:hypothetical protein